MKSFTDLLFLLLSTTLLMTTSVSASSSAIHSPNNHQDHVHLLSRQSDSDSSELLALLEDPSNYPSFPSTDTIPDSTSTSSSIGFSVLGKALIQDLSCRNCSAQGDISIQGASANSDDEDSSGWSLTAAVEGVSAHIEIAASLRPDTDLDYQGTLEEIELETFEIAGLLVVTPKIVVELVVGGQVSVDVELDWGVDVVIPDGASIVIASSDGKNFSASIVGFNTTQITQLPITASISNPELSIGMSLRFNFFLSISPISSLLPSVYAGVYADLPGVYAEFSPVSNVNANCQNITSSETDAALQVAFPNLLYIEPIAFVDVGATIGVDTSGEAISFRELELDEEIATVFIALPSQCLEWSGDAEGGDGGFGAPDVEALTGGGGDDGAGGAATGTGSGSGGGRAPTGTPGSSPSGTAGAAAQTSSNGATSNVLIASEDGRFAWVVAVLALVMSGFGMLL